MGQSPEHTHLFSTIIISTISIVLLFAVVMYGLVNRQLEPIASADAIPKANVLGAEAEAQAETVVAPKTTSLSTETVQAMAQSIQTTLAASSADVSVSIVDIKTGDAYNYGYSGAFLGASVNKLVTATLLLHMIDQGKLTLTTRIGGETTADLLTDMIEQSDNDAWQTLINYVTGTGLKDWAKSNGWNSYIYSDNEVNTSDIAKLLAALYNGSLLSASSKQVLLQHMANANEANHIVQNVPGGVTVYHKAGWLTDYLHDAAIIDNGDRPYALVIFTKEVGIYGTTEAATIYKQITKATLTAFGVQ